MNILLIFPGFIVALIIVFCYERKIRRMRSKVYAYVARDKNESLWLYFGKPIRGDENFFGVGNILLTQYQIKHLGLNENDYANLKWEDEPLEVFVNMED